MILGKALPTGIVDRPDALTTRNRLRLKPMWYNGLRCGESFLDPHDGVLEYHVVPHDRYSSFIDVGPLRIDVDASGCPVLLELDLQSVRKTRYGPLEPPTIDQVQRHRFLDFPIQHRSPRVFIDSYNDLYHIVLSRRAPVQRWAFAPGTAWEVDVHQCLVGLWFAQPVVDPSGCRRAAWRAGVWRAYRQGRHTELESMQSRPERGWLSLPKIFA